MVSRDRVEKDWLVSRGTLLPDVLVEAKQEVTENEEVLLMYIRVAVTSAACGNFTRILRCRQSLDD